MYYDLAFTLCRLRLLAYERQEFQLWDSEDLSAVPIQCQGLDDSILRISLHSGVDLLPITVDPTLLAFKTSLNAEGAEGGERLKRIKERGILHS